MQALGADGNLQVPKSQAANKIGETKNVLGRASYGCHFFRCMLMHAALMRISSFGKAQAMQQRPTKRKSWCALFPAGRLPPRPDVTAITETAVLL